MIQLRDYQEDTKQAVLKEFETVNSTLVVWPTGAGKTVLVASLAKHFFPKRSMFICHRDTLVHQAKRTMEQHFGLRCDVDMASMKAGDGLFEKASVIISTVQTQLAGKNGDRRMHRFDPNDFDLLIVDEFHHYASPEWKKVLDYYRQNPKLKLIGVTASPDRHDELALGQLVESVAKDYEILDAIHDGWLVPVKQQFTKIQGLDFSEVKITAGDLNGAQLAKVMEAEQNLQGVCGATIDLIGDKRAIVFASSIAHAEMASNIFNRHRAGMSEWICESTTKEDRIGLLKRFEDGITQVVANVAVLTEGFDNPAVSYCIMARPTASRALYGQMAGRIMRPLPGVVDGPTTAELRQAAIAGSAKPDCTILDFVGNSGKHKLMTSADILGGKVSDEAIERAIKTAEETGEPVRMDELLDRSEEELRQEAEKRRLEEEARKAKLVAKVRYNTQQISPFEAFDIQPVRSRGWDTGRQLSPRQSAVLMKQGIDPNSLSYPQARQVIGELFKRWDQNLCSFKQAKILKRHGYDTHVGRQEASAIIDLIAAKEGWPSRKPVAA